MADRNGEEVSSVSRVMRNSSSTSLVFGQMVTHHEAARMGGPHRRNTVQNSSAIVEPSGSRLYGRPLRSNASRS